MRWGRGEVSCTTGICHDSGLAGILRGRRHLGRRIRDELVSRRRRDWSVGPNREAGRSGAEPSWLASWAGPVANYLSTRKGRASPARCCSRISASRVRRNKEVVARDCRSVNIGAHGATPIAHASRKTTACVEEETSQHVVEWAGHIHKGKRMAHSENCKARRLCMNRTSEYVVHVQCASPEGPAMKGRDALSGGELDYQLPYNANYICKTDTDPASCASAAPSQFRLIP